VTAPNDPRASIALIEEAIVRLTAPRIEPLAEDDLPDEARVGVSGGPTLNIFRTLAHHPGLAKRWLVFGNHVLGKSTLPARDREIAILRVGWLCRSAYEWGQHVVIGRQCGLDDDEIRRIAEGPEAEGWSPLERAILRATDELHGDAFVSDDTWAALAEHYDTQQLMDLVFAVGQYQLVSMALNSFGVQPEPGLPALPDLD
jgi:alkylhydroperoxidase family enzyme